MSSRKGVQVIRPGLIVLGLLLPLIPVQAQWIERPRTGWVQVAFYHHDTRSTFDTERNTRRIFADGHSVTTSFYVTAAGGLMTGLDAWVQVPIHRLEFNNIAAKRERTGLGDVRFYLRASPEVFGQRSPIPLAIRAGVKVPGGDFPVDAEIIPLGEGQTDMEVMVELGHSFYPRPVYINGWVGYRWRTENTEAARKPGDEWFGYVALGGQLQALSWKLSAEGWMSATPQIQGLSIPSAQREILQIAPSLGYTIGPGVLEIGSRIPLLGRNLPTGAAVFAGYFFKWGKQ